MNSSDSGASPPAELARLRAWLTWQPEADAKGKRRKVPHYATTGGRRLGEQGSAADRANLVTFDEAMAACWSRRHAGVGFAFLLEWGVVGFDFDDCVSEDGTISEPAASIARVCSYAELSPSGRGVHAFATGHLPDRKADGFEVFSSTGFLTFTGRALFGCELFGDPLRPVPDQAFDLYAKLFGPTDLTIADPDPFRALDRQQARERFDAVEVASALDHIAANGYGRTYDEWQRVGQALKAQDAFRLWMSFSSKVCEWTDADRLEAQSKWRQLRGDRTDFRAIFAEAQRQGWRNPKAPKLDTYGDVSNGERFARMHRGRLLFVIDIKRWHQWDGARWRPIDDPAVLAAAKQVAEAILDEAMRAVKDDPSDANKRALNVALAVHRKVDRLRGMITLATSEPGMSIASAAMLDADPMLIGVRNGVVDLRRGTLLQADPDMLISRQAGASFDPQAECPGFLAFLLAAFDGDSLKIEFVQRACGYTLTGLVDEEKLFFCFGHGANGKSVFANVMAAVLDEYAVTVRAELLMSRKHGTEGQREVIRLLGARLALINEVARDELMDDQQVKAITSRERVSARALYSDGIDFLPTHKLWIRGNHQPGVRDGSHGFWRRVLLIGFNRQFSQSEQVLDLDRRIIDAERDGILAWMVRGCLDWQRQRLNPPAAVRQATEAYRADTDVVGEWLDGHCVREPAAVASVEELFQSFTQFAQRAGVQAGSRVAFGRELGSRGFVRAQLRRGVKGWRGIRLQAMGEDVSSAPDAPDEGPFA